MARPELLHIDQQQGLALRRSAPSPGSAERVAGELRALGDTTRLQLALALRDGRELCVCDLAWVCERTQNLTSHHMQVLRNEAIVSARKEGKMTMYRLTPAGVQLVEAALARLEGHST